MTQLARVRTSVLDIAYEHSGTPEAMPVVLLHGYPYDPRAFDGVVAIVTAAGSELSFLISAAMVPRASYRPIRHDQESKQHWARTFSICLMH